MREFHRGNFMLRASSALLCAAALSGQAVPYPAGQAPEAGIDFQLPAQARDMLGRRSNAGNSFGSNALSVSWDGKLLVFDSREWNLWYGTPGWSSQTHWANGLVFCTFDPNGVVTVNGRPTFPPACFGPVNARFATIDPSVQPGPTVPDGYPEVASPYPSLPNSMGELGLLSGYEALSSNLYPIPVGDLPPAAENHNPFPSDASGTPTAGGAFLTYLTYLTLQDQPQFWNASLTRWSEFGSLKYQARDPANPTAPPTAAYRYPNGQYAAPVGAPGQPTAFGWPVKRNGVAKLRITVNPATRQVATVEVKQKWRPFLVEGPGGGAQWQAAGNALTLGKSVPPQAATMYADNFEPVLTNDGHLMIGKGLRNLVTGDSPGGHAQIVFYYNPTPFGISGWKGPWPLHHLHARRNDVVDGLTLAERYPLARMPFKSYDGRLFADENGDGLVTDSERELSVYEGGYCWLDPDGRFVLHSVFSGGVGDGHPQMLSNPDAPHYIRAFDDGGGLSNRAQATIIGSVTGWQQWRIDHAVVNPSRHLFTAWDYESRTTHIRQASFGTTTGFWNMLRDSKALPLRKDNTTKLQLVNSQRLLYYELDLSPYAERDYGFYLPMNEMLTLDRLSSGAVRDWRQVDTTRTPDLSGNGNFGTFVPVGPVGQQVRAQLPCEYFELPGAIQGIATRNVPGLYKPVEPDANQISLAGGSAALAAARLIHPNWGAGTVVQGELGKWWAKLADGHRGIGTAVDADPGYVLPTGSMFPPAGPGFPGRGEKHDMDSDTVWGRVGQAVFFKQGTFVSVDNTPMRPELNPGTAGSAAKSLAVSLWVRPIQPLTGSTRLFQHNCAISLAANGQLVASVTGAGAGTVNLTSSSVTAIPFDWTHVALSWRDTPGTSSSELRLFVNGVDVPGSPMVLPFDTMASNSADIQLGCLDQVAADPARAVLLLDEVALKNHSIDGSDAMRLALRPIPVPVAFDNSNLPPAPPGMSNADAKVPSSNTYDANLARVGADLFHDVQLSGSRTISCATCHVPGIFFTDGLPTATGGQGPGSRNTPTIFNQRWHSTQFWDGRAPDLEAQSLDPVNNPNELGSSTDSMLAYLNSESNYKTRLGVTTITEAHARRALASFMRSPSAGNADADGSLSGPGNAAARRGRGLFFGKARCSGCHLGPTLSDGLLWNTGSMDVQFLDTGASGPFAGNATRGRRRFEGAFKTPSLRDLEFTAPYFHDGHARSLEEVVDFYNAGGVRTDGGGFPLLKAEHHSVAEEINRPLELTAAERDDLVSFLLAFTSATIDTGAVGYDQPPVVALSLVGSTLNIWVTDVDGRDDLDPTMSWTLSLNHVAMVPVFPPRNWAHTVHVNNIANGLQRTIALPAGTYAPGSLRLRIADKHGKWSVVVTN